MNNNEHKLQVGCVKWFRLAYPRYTLNLFSIPNGGSRNIIEAKRLKDEGVLSGAPDLFLSIAKKDFHGFYIEMKFGKNRQSENQKKFEKNIVKYGYKYSLCYSLDEFMNLINNYLK